jgi:serine/threonine-protein kinase
MTIAPGATLGPYRIIDQIGHGGMATVYKAYHAALDRYVAIKVLNPAIKDDPNFLSRFQREARIVAKLDHPNIVPIFDFAIHEDTPYLVMRYIEGKPLKAILRGAPLSLTQTLILIRPVVTALDYAHARGVLHRDIKPSNIIIGQDGQIYLADFGLARMMQSATSTLSQDSLIGTPQYLAPEQAKNDPTDARTDVYALGVVLFEMLTGRVPFSADTPYAIIHDQIYTSPPPPSSINPDLSSDLDQVILTALAKDPNARFANVLDLFTALEKAAGIPSSELSELRSNQTRIFKLDNPRVLAVIAGALVIALIFAFNQFFGAPPSMPNPSATTNLQPIALASVPATETPTIVSSPTVVPTPVPTLAPTSTPTLTPIPLTPTITPSPTIAAPPGMVYIPAGIFWMGANPEDGQANANEKPGHSVEVSAFFIDQYEVSNDDYRRCVTAGNCEIPRGVHSPQSPNVAYGNPAFDNLPVVLVSHRMASLYCEWLGKRLPREAEWEKAARGSADPRIYPWGNAWEGERANSAMGNLGPVPIFTYTPKGCSPFGVCNMVGNVAEWIADAYSPTFYADSIRTLIPPAVIRDPFNSDFNSGNFVIRGGSFKSNAFDSRISKRTFRTAGEAVDDLGFRCVKPLAGR